MLYIYTIHKAVLRGKSSALNTMKQDHVWVGDLLEGIIELRSYYMHGHGLWWWKGLKQNQNKKKRISEWMKV